MNRLKLLIRRSSLLSTLFVTTDDRIVIAQFPNAPLWVAAALFAASSMVRPELRPRIQTAYTAVLIVWSIEEIGWGVNLFRRLLGSGVLVVEVASLVKLLR